jgi:hypothetical protein
MRPLIITGRYQDAILKLPKLLGHDDELGATRTVLPFVCDSAIGDPPYGERTHKGARTTKDLEQEGITYPPWSRDDVFECVRTIAPVTRRWFCQLTSHDLIPSWEDAFDDMAKVHGESEAWFYFAPIPCVIPGMTVRQVGDGPASWTCHLFVSRRSSRECMANPMSNGTALWRALPGAYVVPRQHTDLGGDGRRKPRWLMDAIVRDYSNRGDVVLDATCGEGTTLVSAAGLKRQGIGIEMLADVADKARDRCDGMLQQDLFA